MEPLLVFRKGTPFIFPRKVLEACRLKPNQNVGPRQFWRALSLNAEILIALEERHYSEEPDNQGRDAYPAIA